MFTIYEADADPSDVAVDEASARTAAVARPATPKSTHLAAFATERHDSYWIIEPATHELRMVYETY